MELLNSSNGHFVQFPAHLQFGLCSDLIELLDIISHEIL